MCRCHLESQKAVCKQVITMCLQKTPSVSVQSGLYWFIEASRLLSLKFLSFNEMINKEWPLSGHRQCRTNSTKLEEMDKEKKILSVMDIILTQ